jgi:hypothetical protein
MLKTKKNIRYNFRNLYPHKKARNLREKKMLRFLDKIPYSILIIAAIFMLLALFALCHMLLKN